MSQTKGNGYRYKWETIPVWYQLQQKTSLENFNQVECKFFIHVSIEYKIVSQKIFTQTLKHVKVNQTAAGQFVDYHTNRKLLRLMLLRLHG